MRLLELFMIIKQEDFSIFTGLTSLDHTYYISYFFVNFLAWFLIDLLAYYITIFLGRIMKRGIL